MRRLLKPEALLPILIGIAFAALLFWLGDADDSPGLCLLGISAGLVLILWGTHRAGLVRREQIAPIFLLCFGVGATMTSIILLLDGEFAAAPGLAIGGVLFGVALFAAGMIKARKGSA